MDRHFEDDTIKPSRLNRKRKWRKNRGKPVAYPVCIIKPPEFVGDAASNDKTAGEKWVPYQQNQPLKRFPIFT